MSRKILNPRWMNDSKTQIVCEFVYDDGKRYKAYVSNTEDGNPDWIEIMDTYGSEHLDKVTKEYLDDIKKKRDFDQQRRKEMAETRTNEMLFNAKLEAFSIEEVRNSQNRDLKSKIRKAKSITEVHAFTTLLLQKEYDLLESQKKEVKEDLPVITSIPELEQKSEQASVPEKKSRKPRKSKKSDA